MYMMYSNEVSGVMILIYLSSLLIDDAQNDINHGASSCHHRYVSSLSHSLPLSIFLYAGNVLQGL